MPDFIQFADEAFIRSGECDGCMLTSPGQCCQFLELPLARALSDDEVRWVELHPGVSVIGQAVRINTPCGALKNGYCSLHGTPERPEMCGRYPERPEALLAGCAYTFEKVS